MATIDSNIALGGRPIQIESPLNQMSAVMQLKSAQQANELNRQKMEEYTRAREMEGMRRNALAGIDLNAPDSFNKVAQRLYDIGDLKGADEMLKARDDRDYKQAQTGKEKALAGKADIEGKAEKLKYFTSKLPILAQNATDAAIEEMAGDMFKNGILSFEQANAAAQQIKQLPLEQRNQKIMETALSAKDALERTQPKTEIGKLIAERDRLPPNDPRRSVYDAAIQKSTTHSPGTNVNVALSTEKAYGGQFAGKVADSDIKLKDAAEAAPQLADTSNRISQILKTGQVFTGTGAALKLQLAKALKVVAGTDNEAIANTETLLSSLASQTLANIKSSNLGSGQGFTDKDREFLEKATAGNITFDNKTLQKLSDLSHKAAVASANRWNDRVKNIPSNVLEGTGLNKEPISVPGREGGVTRKPSAVQLKADAILNATPSKDK